MIEASGVRRSCESEDSKVERRDVSGLDVGNEGGAQPFALRRSWFKGNPSDEDTLCTGGTAPPDPHLEVGIGASWRPWRRRAVKPLTTGNARERSMNPPGPSRAFELRRVRPATNRLILLKTKAGY